MTDRQQKKDQTRTKLLGAAVRLLKERGFDGTSVQKVMAQAKLSHGGFYAYFRDKDHLIVEALRWGMDQTATRVAATLPKELPGREKLGRFLSFYLSAPHREQVAEGCPVASLSRDFSRAPLKLRKEFAKELSQMIEQRRELFAEGGRPVPRGEWIGIMSCYVGALVLSRSCEGDPLSDEILEGAREFLDRAIKKG